MSKAPETGEDVLVVPAANGAPFGFRCVAPKSGQDCILLPAANGGLMACAGVAPKTDENCWIVPAANGAPVAMTDPGEEEKDYCAFWEDYEVRIEVRGLTWELGPGGDCDNGSDFVYLAVSSEPPPIYNADYDLDTHTPGTCDWAANPRSWTWQVRDSNDPATLLFDGTINVYGGMVVNPTTGAVTIGWAYDGDTSYAKLPFSSVTKTDAEMAAAIGGSFTLPAISPISSGTNSEYCPFNPTGTATVYVSAI